MVPHLTNNVYTECLLDYSPNLTSLERLRTLVDMYASNMATSIADSGHLYAMMSSASSLSPAAQLSETFNGMTQVNFPWFISLSLWEGYLMLCSFCYVYICDPSFTFSVGGVFERTSQ